jgi:hypothetical protein
VVVAQWYPTYLSPHCKVKGSSPTSATSSAREKMARKSFNKHASGSSTVVEYFLPHLEVKGLIQALMLAL